MMRRIVDHNEVIKLAFNRNIDGSIIKPSMIDVAQQNYLYNYLEDFFLKMIDDEAYNDYIDIYLKPIIAWGILYDNFSTISFSIGDKGVYMLAAEGGAQLLSDQFRFESKHEIKRNLFSLIKNMLKSFEIEKKLKNPLFNDFEIRKMPNVIKYVFDEKKINNPY